MSRNNVMCAGTTLPEYCSHTRDATVQSLYDRHYSRYHDCTLRHWWYHGDTANSGCHFNTTHSSQGIQPSWQAGGMALLGRCVNGWIWRCGHIGVWSSSLILSFHSLLSWWTVFSGPSSLAVVFLISTGLCLLLSSSILVVYMNECVQQAVIYFMLLLFIYFCFTFTHFLFSITCI